MRVILTHHSASDRDEALAYLQAPSNAAEQFLNDLQAGLLHLMEFPRSGHRRADLTRRNVCFWAIPNYFIVIAVEAGTVTVLRILHTSRNLRKEMRRRLE